ncbi:MAG TPA: hypothetical protein VF145_06015 [Chitinophagaceae bacterium]
MEEKNTKEISITEFVTIIRSNVRFLFSKWLLILGIAFLCGLIGIAYAWLQKKYYIAEMSFVTETESKGPISAYAGIAAQFGIDIGGGSNTLFEGDNLIELLRSKTLVIQTLLSPVSEADKTLMIQRYITANKMDRKSKTSSVDFSSFGRTVNRSRDSIVLEVAKQIREKELSIRKRDKKLSIIDMEFFSVDETLAKQFTEQLANNAIRYYTDYKLKKSRQNVAILERQTDSIRGMLYSSIGAVAASTDLNVNPIRQSGRTGTQRRQVDVQANGALYAELVKNLELSRLSLRKETPLIQVIDRPILPLEQKGIGRLLAGLIGAFIGGMLCVALLLAGRWFATKQRKDTVVVS